MCTRLQYRMCSERTSHSSRCNKMTVRQTDPDRPRQTVRQRSVWKATCMSGGRQRSRTAIGPETETRGGAADAPRRRWPARSPTGPGTATRASAAAERASWRASGRSRCARSLRSESESPDTGRSASGRKWINRIEFATQWEFVK